TSLRGSSLRDQAQQTAQQQTQRLDNLMEQIKETVQQAETSEPLLSKRLYDTYRQTLQEKPQEALAQASQWIEDGIPEEAEMPARTAQQGINTLAQGIEQAAESVLGDQAEALRRARDELDQLAEQ